MTSYVIAAAIKNGKVHRDDAGDDDRKCLAQGRQLVPMAVTVAFLSTRLARLVDMEQGHDGAVGERSPRSRWLSMWLVARRHLLG